MKKDTAEPKPKLTPGQIAEQARNALAEQTNRHQVAGAFTLDDNNKLTTGGK
ncbi:hypothetical protein HG263_06880 [Pseudoalteromonas sp. JBTF-M23]|uniref:Uncharacterized protein n=1 Tax=Pseudoalteromonas caenipelagi TaxID=2726988 RepID=A0A849VB93_9GAMM|nr:hypothetical protein [Pseudoalteromonas caenipelagi]NOU50265.1 hypothetical protein [Pseudoalteromonas caenipelagi]